MGNTCKTKAQQNNLEKTVERPPISLKRDLKRQSSDSEFLSRPFVEPFECEPAAALFDSNFDNDSISGRSISGINTETVNYLSGASYYGQMVNSMRHGKGTFRDSEGNVFTGDFVEDHINGKGIYRMKDGTRYEGEFKDDLQHGFGREVWNDGAVYEGQYSEGLKHGNGRYKFPDGSVFEGQFVEGSICGYVS